MGNNIGYLKADKNNDECYTPYYAVQPLLKYIDSKKVIWTPFDKEYSAFVQLLKQNGNTVIHSHLEDGYDFFNYEPFYYDIIISNPPFSIKDKILKRLYELNKPFAILLPLNSLQGVTRYKYFCNGIQLLSFDQRIGFHNLNSMVYPIEGSPFASAYFCKDILPRDLIIEELHKENSNPLYREMIRDINKEMIILINN